ncbi:MAG: 50S ribosomal protein L13 [Candidatus Micrarchaeia archaeon]|jgi:large subunit ribosomal protein L13
MIFDAENAIMGRLAALVAKNLVKGEKVVVVNVEKAVISGEPKKVVEVYRKRREMTNKANPEHASKWPRRPDYLFKRVVQAMLPKTARGEKALKNFRAFMGVPPEFKEAVKTKKDASKLSCKSITLEELCFKLGWKY